MQLVLVGINISSEWRSALARGDAKNLYLLTGTIEILVGDWMANLGKFDDALFLLPTIDALIVASSQLVASAPRIAVDVTGNGRPLSIVRQHNKKSTMVTVACGGSTSLPIAANELADAFAEAILDFLRMLASSIPPHQWPQDAIDVAVHAKKTWDRPNSAGRAQFTNYSIPLRKPTE